jgi:hypothetical protein
MWEPLRLTTLWASTACYKDSFSFTFTIFFPISLLFLTFLSFLCGRAVAQRLDAGFPLWRLGFAYGQHVGFVVDNAALGQVFSEYFGFLCQSFHQFLHYHNHPGLTQ